jgi:hypothetical protein
MEDEIRYVFISEQKWCNFKRMAEEHWNIFL